MPDAAPVTSATRPSMVAMCLIIPRSWRAVRARTPFRCGTSAEALRTSTDMLVAHSCQRPPVKSQPEIRRRLPPIIDNRAIQNQRSIERVERRPGPGRAWNNRWDDIRHVTAESIAEGVPPAATTGRSSVLVARPNGTVRIDAPPTVWCPLAGSRVGRSVNRRGWRHGAASCGTSGSGQPGEPRFRRRSIRAGDRGGRPGCSPGRRRWR